MKANEVMIAGVELGGTKCVCILASGPGRVVEQVQVPTTDPETTLGAAVEILRQWRDGGVDFAAIGVASFGPLDLDPSSPHYGSIKETTKVGWANADVLAPFRAAFDCPIGFNTDVNGAAVAEGLWGAAYGLDDFAYITVGTGVGVGLVAAGKLIQGAGHCEAGHIRVPRQYGDAWPGACIYHGDCVEGLASGTAVKARLGQVGAEVAPTDPVWDGVAFALAQLVHSLVLTAAPRRILVGGGVVMGQQHLLPRIRHHLHQSLGGYVGATIYGVAYEDYLMLPGLGKLAGPYGAIALGQEAVLVPFNAAIGEQERNYSGTRL